VFLFRCKVNAIEKPAQPLSTTRSAGKAERQR
jgi:hypothetical protein